MLATAEPRPSFYVQLYLKIKESLLVSHLPATEELNVTLISGTQTTTHKGKETKRHEQYSSGINE